MDQRIVLDQLKEKLVLAKSKFGGTNIDHTIDGVIEELGTRAEFGLKKYGTYLKTWNGRSAAQDLREELLDALMYNEQLLMETSDRTDGRGVSTELYLISIRVNLVNMLSMLDLIVRAHSGGDHVPASPKTQAGPTDPGQPQDP